MYIFIKRINNYFNFLTVLGNTLKIPIDTSRPQAAPVNKVGMNSPFDVDNPNVHTAKKK